MPAGPTLLKNFIGGEWVPAAASAEVPVVDPRTETLVVRVPAGSAEDADAAVRAARAATSDWAATPLRERVRLVERVANAVESHIADLAKLERREMGKPLREAELFIRSGVQALRSSIKHAHEYQFVEAHAGEGDTQIEVVRLPLGVVALIVPWNFTVTNVLLAVGPLLLAGNTVVVKPSEKAPLSAVRMFELLELPRGVLNLLLGDGRAGEPLAAHPGVDLVHFTGSVKTGQTVGALAASNLHRAVLELGGNDPAIVDAGVDPAWAAQQLAYACFVNSGQICTSVERIYVHTEIADAFIEALVAQAEVYTKGGDGSEPSPLGPLVDARQRQIVHRHVSDAVSRGAELLAGGYLPDGPGFYYPATVLLGVEDEADLLQEETFGPVAPIVVVRDFDEAIDRAQRSPFGLAATILSADPRNISRAQELPAGIVWINEWQGGGFDRTYEPAGISGMGATGGAASYDAATRPMTIVHARAKAR
ncbi:aldehyde dehydrogenase family protein [Phytohabitans kaempferiae]|uniref:Aldehyde dehydrogenase family protein n=1 Tax=Phytohabitans kaempferiae TaxID=1620943 RepID=A0ABV6LYI3_9ACTN